MELASSSFSDGGVIPGEYAFCVPDPDTHVTFGGNRSPHLSWSDLPEGTRSLALICHDRDVPTKPDDVNQEDREVPADLPRADFYHWVCVNLDPDLAEIPEGAFSTHVTEKGKRSVDGPYGTRQGVNDYTGWFAGDEDMEGTYLGYDGPCPPWNDSIIHHYVFTLYALDSAGIEVGSSFSGADLIAAIEGHVLGQASIVGTYSLNARVG